MSLEFNLIETLCQNFSKNKIKKSIGDDTAVIEQKDGTYQLITVDALVENDHFSCAWSSPLQIGKKAIEVNVSDIAAMGGIPQYVLISLVINKKINKPWLKKLYQGIQTTCEKYKIELIGGDTTHGQEIVISITMIGKTDKKNLCLRSQAQNNDLICITGQAGASAACYLALQQGLKISKIPEKIKNKHLEPQSRLEASKVISKYAHAMIDVSDGIGSEVKHIARESEKGAILYQEKIPVMAEVLSLEKKIKLPAYSCALSGGEDFELLFTISPKNMKILKKYFQDFSVIGEIQADPKILQLIVNNKIKKIPDGYDHLLQKEK